LWEKDSNNGYIFDSYIDQLSDMDITHLKEIPSRHQIDNTCAIGWHEAGTIAQQFCGITPPSLPLNGNSTHSKAIHEGSVESERFSLDHSPPDEDGSHLTPSIAIALQHSRFWNRQ